MEASAALQAKLDIMDDMLFSPVELLDLENVKGVCSSSAPIFLKVKALSEDIQSIIKCKKEAQTKP